MARGRPRKPKAQHRMDGTYRHDRHGGRSEPAAKGKPKMPRGLNADEKWLWNLVVSQWMGEVDTAQLRQLCTLWYLLQCAMKSAKDDPIDKDARLAVNQYSASFDRLAAKFGLNPADRAKLSAPAEESPKSDEERFFGVVG